jgi:hypothetical protein
VASAPSLLPISHAAPSSKKLNEPEPLTAVDGPAGILAASSIEGFARVCPGKRLVAKDELTARNKQLIATNNALGPISLIPWFRLPTQEGNFPN